MPPDGTRDGGDWGMVMKPGTHPGTTGFGSEADRGETAMLSEATGWQQRVGALRRFHRIEPEGPGVCEPRVCMGDGEVPPCETIRLLDVAETARDALVILAALDLSVQWELAPEVKAKIHDATTRLTAALTALVDTSRREIEPDAHP